MNNYNFLHKMFHSLIVNNFFLLNFSFDLEKFFFNKTNYTKNLKKLFITGYARSGTTILLNNLYNTNKFKSLTYNDLPFVLSPTINKFFHIFKSNNKSQERAHQDGIKIDISSPEALEEIFWKNRLKDNYIHKDYLKYNFISEEVISDFDFFLNIINYENKIYLSKNNNNILRLNYLTNLNNSLVLVIFRDPIYHCFSLLKQHQNFCELQKKNKFILNFMNSIGHYEFGLNHKVFFDNHKSSLYQIDNINYWLYQWIKIYSNILEIKKNNKKKFNFYFL